MSDRRSWPREPVGSASAAERWRSCPTSRVRGGIDQADRRTVSGEGCTRSRASPRDLRRRRPWSPVCSARGALARAVGCRPGRRRWRGGRHRRLRYLAISEDLRRGEPKLEAVGLRCEHERRRQDVNRGAVEVMEVVWPSGAAVRGEVPNHPGLHWLKTVVVNVVGKGAARSRQVGVEKMSDGRKPSAVDASKGLRRRRNQGRANVLGSAWGHPFTAQAASGVQAA